MVKNLHLERSLRVRVGNSGRRTIIEFSSHQCPNAHRRVQRGYLYGTFAPSHRSGRFNVERHHVQPNDEGDFRLRFNFTPDSKSRQRLRTGRDDVDDGLVHEPDDEFRHGDASRNRKRDAREHARYGFKFWCGDTGSNVLTVRGGAFIDGDLTTTGTVTSVKSVNLK